MRGDVQCPNNTALRTFVGSPESAAPQLKVPSLPPRAPGVGGGPLGHSEVDMVLELEMPARPGQAFEGGLVCLRALDLGLCPSGQGCRPVPAPLYLFRGGFAGSSTFPTG